MTKSRSTRGYRQFGAFHRFLYRMGVARRVFGAPVLILQTTGRRSGRSIETPLTFFEDDRSRFVIGSKGGADDHPAWYLNLVAEPRISARIGDRQEQFTAVTVTDPTERKRLYALAIKHFKGYAGYETKTERQIPVVRLLPRSTED